MISLHRTSRYCHMHPMTCGCESNLKALVALPPSDRSFPVSLMEMVVVFAIKYFENGVEARIEQNYNECS